MGDVPQGKQPARQIPGCSARAVALEPPLLEQADDGDCTQSEGSYQIIPDIHLNLAGLQGFPSETL